MLKEFEGAIGIDLGTTYSCVAVFLHDQVQVIPNDQGNRTSPSYVAFQHDEVIVGDGAKNLSARGASSVIFDAKRLIGMRLSEKTVQEDCQRWPFVISDGGKGDDKPRIHVEFKGESLQLDPVEVSARVLAYLKTCAESYLGKQVKKAVITVPAYFNDSQRQATKDAGVIAGLEVLRIINEPTAAALSYGIGVNSGAKPSQSDGKPLNALVFDFGGGTFDVSIITIDMGSFAVRATGGDTHLGGQDMDFNLLAYITGDLEKRHGVHLFDQHPRQMARARAACEVVKKTLSHSTSEELVLDGLLPGGDEYTLRITRAKLEELNEKIFDKCISVVKHVLKDAAMTVEDINEIIMVGGSSRIPKLHNLLKDLFKCNMLCNSVHPDEAVAIGAAIQASILSNSTEQQSERTEAVVLMDVVPLSIGVEVDNGKLDVLIPRNTTIPYKIKKEYSTVEDYQTDVDIQVFEGERPLTRHNHKLGEFSLEGITKAKKGHPTITVTFSIDADGLLTVSATEALANKTKSLVVQNSERLSGEEVMAMVEASKKFQGEDTLSLAKTKVSARVSDALAKLKEKVTSSKEPPSDNLQKRLDFIQHAEEWLSRSLPNYTDLESLKSKSEKIMQLINKGMKRARPEKNGSQEGNRKSERRESDSEDSQNAEEEEKEEEKEEDEKEEEEKEEEEKEEEPKEEEKEEEEEEKEEEKEEEEKEEESSASDESEKDD
ncbi:unnamed protein product [Phytomonas sp. Hart1]|nr:unnamed protein product [Phytomonas sp. Hart1]|eukprot:CCW68559.1 unnamed protein product [Phytomonas sp. isolate Hart1]